jgi:hypothetical protein
MTVRSLALALLFCGPAFADGSLAGQPVYGELGVNFSSSDPFDDAGFDSQLSASGVVGPGVELVIIANGYEFDFSNDGRTLTVYLDAGFGSVPFNGFRFELTDPTAPNFMGFHLLSSTIPGFSAGDVAVSGRRLALNFAGLEGTGEIVIRLFNDGVEVPELSVAGTCPGPTDLTFTGFTPGGRVALLKGTAVGSSAIPAGPCAGLSTDLQDLALHAVFVADGAGQIALSPNLPLAACGRVVQALDVEQCELSEPVSLP